MAAIELATTSEVATAPVVVWMAGMVCMRSLPTFSVVHTASTHQASQLLGALVYSEWRAAVGRVIVE